jgi:hypothetical protein
MRSLVAVFLIFGKALLAQSGAFTLSSGSTVPGGSALLNLSLASSGGQPVAVQWTFTYSPTDVVGITVSAGAAVTAAGKTMNCFSATGAYTCVVSGMNASTIANGIVATANVTVSSAITAAAIGISGSVGADASGSAYAVSGTGSSITVTGGGGSPTLSGLSCSPASLSSAASSVCTVTLSSAAASGGTTVAIASNNSLLPAPV